MQQEKHEAEPRQVSSAFSDQRHICDGSGNNTGQAPDGGKRHRDNQDYLLPVRPAILVYNPYGERGIGKGGRAMAPKTDERP